MGSFFSFILFVAWLMLVYRAVNFIGRAKAKHREMLAKAGYEENDPEHRLRRQKAARVGWIAYAVIGGLLQIILHKVVPVAFVAMILSAMAAFIPSVMIFVVYWLYWEIVLPNGECATQLRINQWHLKAPKLEPKGERGTGVVIPGGAAGLLNPVYWVVGGFRPIIPQPENPSVRDDFDRRSIRIGGLGPEAVQG